MAKKVKEFFGKSILEMALFSAVDAQLLLNKIRSLELENEILRREKNKLTERIENKII